PPLPTPLTPPRFPYTTLFRSRGAAPPSAGDYLLGPRLDERAGVERFSARRAHGGQSSVFLLREPISQSDPLSAVKWPSLGWEVEDRKSTRLNSSHQIISYAVF